MVLLRRQFAVILIVAWLLALVSSRAIDDPILHFLGNSMILEFLIGVGIARMKPTHHHKLGLAAIALGVATVLMFTSNEFGIVTNMFDGTAFTRGFVWGLPAGAITWGALQFEDKLTSPLLRPLSLGGDASYSIYLSHPIFLLAKPDNPYVLLFVGTPILIALGIAVHWFVEKPLLRWSRRPVGIQSVRGHRPKADPGAL